jgi:hypothetical protein
VAELAKIFGGQTTKLHDLKGQNAKKNLLQAM